MHHKISNPVLFMDAGNTSIKICLAGKENLGQAYTLPTNPRETSDSLGLHIEHICQREGLLCAELENWVIASVVPPVSALLEGACRRFAKQEALQVPKDLPVPLANHYARPQEVGIDRLLGSYAARCLQPQARSILVVDFGTATTFDCVQDNAFVGGLICPGIQSSVTALGTQTAKLPHISLNVDSLELDLGTSTRQSLNHGVLFGFAAMLEGLVCRLKKRLQDPQTQVIATGGFAPQMAKLTSCIDQMVPDLLLQGLHKLYFQ